MDFVHDQLATGKKIRVLTVVDTFSRYVPVLDPRFSYRAEDVVRTLEKVCPTIGSEDDQGRSRLGVHLPRSRPMGLYERGDARLQQPGEADR
jgi:transposase InsO family protein